MAKPNVPHDIEALFQSAATPAVLLEALMPAIGRALDCERCLLFLRDPLRCRSRMTHGWWDKAEHAYERAAKWSKEPATLAAEDPLFAEALRNPRALFIDDIEGAAPGVLDVDYERTEFRHRALVHAPLYDNARCYGVLEPCVFDAPRRWSAKDRALVEWLQRQLGPIAAAYVGAHAP